MTIKKLLKRSGWSLLALFLALNILTAIHAYHFTHFYDDPGIKRVDKGDLSFTQKTNAAFFGIKSSKSVNLSRPTVPYNVIHLKTQEGLDLEGWHLYQSSSIGTVLMFHGHGSCKSKIIDEAMNFYSL